MVGSVLHRKLLREVKEHWAQFAAAAAVVTWATVLFVAFQTAYASLVLSRDSYYARYNFADFFVHLEKAPRAAVYDVESIPGVWRARGRVVEDVPLELSGREGAVVGRFISMPDPARGRAGARRDVINGVHIVSGGYFPGAAREEVIVNRRFCEANGLQVGDTFQATISRRKETLRIVGTAYSPEYVYALRSGQQFAPDDAGFALVFGRRSFVEDAFGMTGAFNDLVGVLRPEAGLEGVLEEVEQRLSSYGVYLKYGRDEQMSNRYLSEELKGLRTSARVVPVVFLTVAAIVVHVIVGRMVEMQRTQIGLLAALGYAKGRIVAHYVSYALVIALAGTVLGAVLGLLLAGQFVQMYNTFFRFPSLRLALAPAAMLAALALNCAMCVLGAAHSAWRVLRLDPAVAIRPSAPASSRALHPGRLGLLWRRLPLSWRMSARNSLRAGARSLFSVFGVGIATMILIVGTSSTDFFDWMVDYHYGKVDRSDLRVDFATERPEAAVLEVAAARGVRRAEGILQFAAELRNGWRTKDMAVLGLSAGDRLYLPHDAAGNPVKLPPDGLLLPRRIARDLGLRPGDRVLVEPYLRDKDERFAAVGAVVDQYLGAEVYADRRYLARLLGEGPIVNGAVATVERGSLGPVMDHLDDLPGVAAVTSTRTTLQQVMEEMRGLMALAQLFHGLAAGIIAFAVIYNTASVSISEQERDLACLRSLGYEQGTVADIATHDVMPLGLLGIAAGMPAAYGLSHLIAGAYETDLYKLPVVVNPLTYGQAAVLIMAFLLVSRWISRRRVNRINIVERLKTRE